MADASLAGQSGIYEIVNTMNGKRYIGSAVHLRQRWREHRSALRRGRHHSRVLQNAWNKYGEDAFVFSVLKCCRPEDLIAVEQSAFDDLSPEYNICRVAGSTYGRLHSDETKDRIRDRAIGRKCKPRTEEHRRALSLAHKGKPKASHVMLALQAGRAARVRTPEELERVSESLKLAYATGLRAREKSEKHKQNIGKAFAKLSDDEVREIRRLRADGVGLPELSERFGCPKSTVSQIARGIRYRWVAM